MMIATPSNEQAEASWQMNAGAMSKLEASSDDSEDGAVDNDCFTKSKVVDVDSLDFSRATAATEPADSVSTTSDESFSVASAIEEDEDEAQEVAAPITAKVGQRRVRSSIKLSSLHAEIPVKTRRGSWMNLPEPDMDKILQSSRSLLMDVDEEEDDDSEAKEERSVRFDTVTVRNYDQTIGDNPSVSYGPPIQLDWKYEELKPIAVEDFESCRPPRRLLKNMALSYYHRMGVLQNQFGCSEADLKEAKRRASSDKFKRGVTRYFLPYRLLEDAVESSVRKTKRALQRKSV